MGTEPNTGLDEILDVSIEDATTSGNTQASRFLVQFSQTEISDEEIEKEAKNHHNYYEWSAGAKWYREQLKQRQCNK